MSRRARLLLTIGGWLAGVLLVLTVTLVFVVQSNWFANFVRDKIVSATEDSTGGRVELGSFQFDWSHLTVRIRNFVLHGTEPAGSDPLARVALLEVHLKLLSAFRKIVDVQYVGIERPQVNLIVLPDGKTNVPEPKVKTQSSNSNSGLETVVNLAVGRFQIDGGLLQYAQRKSAFSGRGENLRVLLTYNATQPSYQGSIRINPLLITSGSNPTLGVHVNVPIAIEKNGLRVSNASLNTAQSQIQLTGSVLNLNAPQIEAQMKAVVSLPEMQESFALPIDSGAKLAPKTLNADMALSMNGTADAIQVRYARIGFGATSFDASGTLDPQRKTVVQFDANFALNELAALLKVSGTQIAGALQANGDARVDAYRNYVVNGTLDSRALSIRSGATRLSDLRIHSPFHADPYLISLDGLSVNAFGGSLAAKIFVEKLERLSVEGSLHNFSLPVLAAAFTGKRLGYDGDLNGTIKAEGDLKAKGTTGYTASANLGIAPGHRGVPVSGRILASYNGARDSLDLAKSYVAMPNSRLDLSGALNQELDVQLVSRNLNDFLPAANFGLAKPQSSLPVVLQGGTAQVQAQIRGNLSAPKITGHLAVDRFAVEQRSFDNFSLDLAASSSAAEIQNGLLRRRTLTTNFDAAIGLRKWSPLPRSSLSANVSLRNGDVADLLALSGESNVPATGNLNADIHINGTYGNPLGTAGLQVTNASAYQQPIDHLLVTVSLADQLITLSQAELASADGRINANGTFSHPRTSFTVGHAQFHIATSNVQLGNIRPLQQQSPGVAGLIQLTADAAADLRSAGEQTEVNIASVNADLNASGLKVQNQSAGDLTATARTSNGAVAYKVASNFAGSNIRVDGNTSLAKDYRTTADALIENLSLQKALQIVGQGAVPVRGNFSAQGHVAGTLKVPSADLQFALAKANVYQEPVDRLEGRVNYSNSNVEIPSVRLDVPAGSVMMNGSFAHPVGSFSSGALRLKVDSTDIDVSKIVHAQQAKPGLAGTLHLAADVSASMRDQGKPALVFSQLTATASANRLRVGQLSLGDAEFAARTTGQNLTFRLDSDLAKTQVHASGVSQLTGDYPTHAKLSFTNIRYVNIALFIEADPAVKPGFDALVEGSASLDGPALRADNLSAKLQLDRLELRTLPSGSVTGAPPGRVVSFQNEGAITVALDKSNLQVQQFHLRGPRTTVDIGGGVNLKNQRSPLAITVAAEADLGVMQDVDRDFYSSGALAMNAVVRGTYADPLVNGQVELKNANVNYADAPNGLSNANGVIVLNGTNASIQNLTAESGGGKISMGGFVGYTGNSVNFNLRANADRVRVRYSGVSLTTNAAIALTGNTRRSLLNGNVTVQKIAYGTSSDAGSFLSSVSTPPTTPSTPSPVLSGMRLDIHILTAPNLRVVTTYADRLSADANLTVRGTAASPGMLGRVVVTDGQLVFFGNQYSVNTGTVNFYNPTSIEPVLNVSLETIAQNVDVVLGVTGPMNNLALTYRSDPPLSFEQIVSLLATNTTPSDPTIAARQPAPQQQSLSQMGESAVLGQAVANPLASRVQRVFGISALKIDPSFGGSNGAPTAKVTLQQKIASNITFTYITDVTQTNSQIIRLEWALTPKLSAVGLRDYNGDVSIQFFYKFKVR